MTRMRRILASALIPAMILIAAGTASAGRPNDKVDVCHRTGNGSFHVINISTNALSAHMRHGDVLPDEYGDC